MELVYLWVEDYKNIHKQGFNFSPRFECTFHDEYVKYTNKNGDEKERLENNCKLEIKDRDYIENFFSDNINITAIVGKNGSGKSSILEFIVKFINNLLGKNFDFLVMVMESFIFIFYDKENKLFIPIYSITKDIELFNSTSKNIIDNKLYTIRSMEYQEEMEWVLKNLEYPKKQIDVKRRINQDILEKSYLLKISDVLRDNLFTLHYDYSFNKFEFYTDFGNRTFVLCVPNKENDILNNSNFDKLIIIRHLVEKDYIDKTSKYFEPKDLVIKNRYTEINMETDIKKAHIDKCSSLSPLEYIKYIVNIEILKMVEDRLDKSLYTFLIKNENNLNSYINENFIKLGKIFQSESGSKTIPHANNMEKALKYHSLLEKVENEDLFIYDVFLPAISVNLNYINSSNIKLLTELPPNCFNIDIKDNEGKEYDNLSNGEKSALRIRFYIEDIISKKKQNNFLVLLDEPVNDMHPNWQKKLLSYLVETFKNRKQNIHFIFTTHSPFMISDLPKQNVIFLDKDKKTGNCIVTEELKQTFGANIHTLLSDSFFMEDGLIGEFAKSKINEIIDSFNNKNSVYANDKQKLKKVIESIGEPFLKDKLLKMYDEKYPPTDEEKIKALEEQIASIKNGQN